jgi:uncharacterized protein DUF4326
MTVVNLKTNPTSGAVYIGRPSPFGNPFVIGPDGDRADVILKFRDYFHERLRIDPDWKKKVEGLRGKTLSCFCAPLSCHGEIIEEWLTAQRSNCA